ncbi:MAG: MFS transporter [Holophagaceae bacterium]|uniref:MFS transporter n=1 Tax=Candidatus Geothrix skivensis TaxID=2954439 RepID=A0A9D7SD58_9BACT|nr:MFS transporter [Candidatus Geothrix skivensis]
MRRPAAPTAALLVTALAFHVDMLLYYLLVPLLPRYARDLALNPMQVGILFGSYAVALLLATFPVAILTDRHGRRAVMLWGLVGLAVTTLVFAVSKQYWLLVLARFLQGVAGSATWLPGMALLADHFPTQSRGKAMGTAFAAANLGVLIGPPLSGLLDQHVGPSAPFLLGAALVALDAAGRAFLLPVEAPDRGPRLPIRLLLANPVIRLFAGAMALGSALWALLESTLPLDLDQRLGLSSSRIGLCFAAAALSHTITSPLIGRLSDRIGRLRVLRMGLVLVMILLPLPVLLPKAWMVVLAMMALGTTASFIMSPCSPAVADQVERQGSQSFASAFSILNLAYSVGLMLGPLLGGALVQSLGLPWALGLCGLGMGSYLLAVRRFTV